ncbi:hypothetical protein SNK05_001524 [Fusarium graminearum]
MFSGTTSSIRSGGRPTRGQLVSIQPREDLKFWGGLDVDEQGLLREIMVIQTEATRIEHTSHTSLGSRTSSAINIDESLVERNLYQRHWRTRLLRSAEKAI